MERKLVIVAFGDLIGFGPWIKRALNDQEVRDAFMLSFFSELEAFILKYRVYMKYIGDGFMMLREFPSRGQRNAEAMRFLHECAVLNARMQHIVKACPWPAPGGFRIRVVSGYVNKFMAACPIQSACSISKECSTGKVCVSKNSLKIPEYIGYAVNLSERLLSIRPEIACICHESVVSLIGKRRNDVKFHHLPDITDKRRGVDQEDLEGLYQFELLSSHS